MQICICGWYYNDRLFGELVNVNEEFPIFIVAHNSVPDKWKEVFSYQETENIGLEWGAYNYFLMRVWEEGNTIYMHDDTIVTRTFFRSMSQITADHAFIFRDGTEQAYNSGGHGRCMFTSDKFQSAVRSEGGFWYDKHNNGFIAEGHFKSESPPDKCSHHNAAIHRFMRRLPGLRKNYGLEVNAKVKTKEIKNGRRGRV